MATYGVNIASLAEQGRYKGLGSITSIFAACFGLLVAIGLVHYDPVPLNSALAPLVHMWRLGHLRSLYDVAQRWGFTARGPEPPGQRVIVEGTWHGRPFDILSGATLSVYFLEVALVSNRKLWPLFVGPHPRLPDNIDANYSRLSGVYTRRFGLAQKYYLLAPKGVQASPELLQPLQMILEEGRHFLHGDTIVIGNFAGVLWRRRSIFRMTENAEDMERLITWLERLVQAMETAGFTDSITNNEEFPETP